MKTKISEHNQKIKRLKEKLKSIEEKYPDFDFKDREMFRDLKKHDELTKKLIYSNTDSNACKSDNPDFMCENCNCWKHTRAMCS